MISVEDIFKVAVEKNFPFAAYRKPGEINYEAIIQTSAYREILPDEDIMALQGFVFAPFEPNTGYSSVLIQPDFVFSTDNFSSDRLESLKKMAPAKLMVVSPENNYECSREEFIANVRELIKRIHAGEFQKAIMSRVIRESKLSTFIETTLFLDLCRQYPQSFISLVNIPGIGRWIGASPELLLERNNGVINLVSLAGTQPFRDVPISEVYWTDKEFQEQKIVTDYISNLLNDFNVSLYKTSGPETVKAGRVYHLKTLFSLPEMELNGHTRDFIDRLHPTPAIWGQPKTSALEIIKTLEKHRRKYYAGYLGPVNMNNQVNLYVNLRTMQVLEDALVLYVGNGITSDSDPAKEWDETCMKAETLLSVIRSSTKVQHP